MMCVNPKFSNLTILLYIFIITEYQESKKPKAIYKVKDVDVKWSKVFLRHLLDTKNYQQSYALKKLADLKTVCNDAELNGIEIQKYYADLANRNAKTNSAANIYCCDIQNLPSDIKERSFDHVISNPPFYAPNKGTPSKDFGKDISLRELLSLGEWVKIAYKRLKQRGFATFIVGVDRLPDILIEGTKYFGNIKVKPICSRVDSPANRVLIQMQKDTKGPFSLLSPLVVHKNLSHETDLKDFIYLYTYL